MLFLFWLLSACYDNTNVLSDLDDKTYLTRHHIIFKCPGFMPSHYISVINLNVVLSFKVFSEFDYVSQSNVLLV